MLRPRARLCALFALAVAANALADEPGTPPPAPAAGAPSTSPSAAPSPPPAPAASSPAPSPAPQPAAVVALVPAPPPTEAAVHIAADYPNARLEGRSRVDLGEWRVLCAAPCDQSLRVDGLEVRVTAPDMTTSNVFVIDPGGGTARLRVSGGSSTSRRLGIIGLAVGLPIAFGGMTLFGVGSVEDQQGVRTAGIATLGVGAAAVLVALPLLLVGATTVRNERGSYIAGRRLGTFRF